MADYDAKIRVSADTKQAESQLKQLQDKLNNLSRAAGTVNTASVEAGIRGIGNVAQNVGTEVKNIFSRGLFAGAILGAGQLGTSISAASSNLGPFTGAVKAAGAAFSSSLGGAPALIGDILNQIGQVPNAMGLAAVAAMAFAPQILKASSAAVGLGAAIDTAVGNQATQAIANAVSKLTGLKTEVNATKAAFENLIEGSTLNQLNKQLQDATYQAGEYHSTTVEAVTAANQLAAVLKVQRAEQEAITDLAREAQGLRPQSVENRATNTYNVIQRRKENTRVNRNEMAAVEQSIASISQQPTDFTRALGLDVADDKLRRFNAEMDKVQEALGRMETSGARNPFGITAQQIELADHNAKKFASDIDLVNTQLNELVQVHQALGRMEGKPQNIFGIELDQVEEVYNMRVKEEAAYEDLRLDTIRRSIDAELDGIDVVFKARNKANMAALKDFDKRLQGREETKKGRQRTVENVALGAGFPLLFGGGPGAVLGGAAGGLIPGNPMMSVVTSAIGTMFDQFVTGVQSTAAALSNLTGNFETLKQANIFASKAQEYNIQKLIESGRILEANAAIQARLANVVGNEGLRNFAALEDANQELIRSFGALTAQLQSFIAGPLAAFLREVSKYVKPVTVGTEAAATQQNLPAAKQSEFFNKRANVVIPGVLKGLVTGDFSNISTQLEQLNTEYQTKVIKPRQKLSQAEIETVLKKNQELYVTLAEAERAQQDTKRQNVEQYFDLVLSLQRQQADLTAQYERRAQDMRIANQQKQLDLIKEKGNLEVQQAQNQATRTQIALGGGTGLTAEITAALDKYSIEVKRINGEAANAQEQAKLDLIRLDIDNERFKMDNAKAIARTNYDNQVKIQRINNQITRQNAELNRKNYEQTIQTAAIELSNIRAGAQAEIATAKANLTLSNVTKDQLAFWQAIIDGFSKVVTETETAKTQIAQGYIKPSPLPSMAAAPALAQPSTTGIDAQTNAAKKLTEQFNALAQARKKVNTEEAALALTQTVLQSVTQFEAQTKAINDEITVRKIRNRLALEGVKPEIIEGEVRVFELTRQITETTKALDGALEKLLPAKLQNTNESYAAAVAYLAELEVLGQLTPAQEKLRAKLQEILDLRKSLQDATPGAVQDARGAAAGQVQTPQERLESRIGDLKKELADLTDPVNMLVTAADAIGTAFSTSFKGIIDGSMTAREALGSFFQSVADAFLDMAAQIIAKWITMTILNSVLQLFPGGGGKGLSNLSAPASINNPLGDLSGIGVSYRAAGGPVTGGMPYIVGERGPELFMPGRSGTVIPNDALGGGSTNVVVNVDASGNSNVQSDQQQAKQLGVAVSAAVQAELVKQQRPGGLLAGTRR